MSHEVFMVFEGGGAKGVSHIGALKAVEQNPNFTIRGTAGTSAGAVVAALVAAGYTHEEIFSREVSDPDCKRVRSIFDFLDEETSRPTDLFRRHHWWLLGLFRRLSRLGALAKFGFAFVSFCLVLFPVVEVMLFGKMCLSDGFSLWCNYFRPALWILYGVCLVSVLGIIFYLAKNFDGFASLGLLVSAVDKLLDKKFQPADGERVTFGTLREQEKKLKIVASNVSLRKLQLFSTESDASEKVAVADAVAASCAIPLVFRPVKIQGEDFCDGGMVSNLPAWTFDEHLLDNDQYWVVTSEIAAKRNRPNGVKAADDALHNSKRRKGINYYRDLAHTAMFGASDLNTRGLSHHVRLPLPIELGVLDFDAPPIRSLAAVMAASAVTTNLLSARLSEISFLQDIHCEAEKQICQLLGVEPKDLKLRCALAREVSLSRNEIAGYHLWQCQGFDGCADKHLKFAKRSRLIHECLALNRGGSFADLTTTDGKERFFGGARPELLKSVTPEYVKWALALPLRKLKGQSGLGRISVAVTFDGAVSISDSGNQPKVRKICKDLCKQWNSV